MGDVTEGDVGEMWMDNDDTGNVMWIHGEFCGWNVYIEAENVTWM